MSPQRGFSGPGAHLNNGKGLRRLRAPLQYSRQQTMLHDNENTISPQSHNAPSSGGTSASVVVSRATESWWQE